MTLAQGLPHLKAVFESALTEMDSLFGALERKVPSPVKVPRGDGFVFRYEERTLEQAVIQKLARLITGLRAAHLLLREGLFQEVGVLQRVLSDFQEEIIFLALAEITNDKSEIHERFLEGFYMGVIDDPANPMASLNKKRPVVSRADIRKAIEHSIHRLGQQSGKTLAAGSDEARVVSTLYNSFAHGGSFQILEMYGGRPPHYHLRGMLGTPRLKVHETDLWNQFYRAAVAFGLAAKAVKDQEGYNVARRLAKMLADSAGKDY